MKKTKFVVSLLSVSLLFAGLTACGEGKKEQPVYFSFSAALDSGLKSVKLGESAQIDIVEAQSSDYDPENPVEHEYTYASSDEDVLTVTDSGEVTGVANGAATVTVTELTEDVVRNIRLDVYDGEALDGAVSYSNSVEEKADILGKLEKYAMDENLTGISLFENGGYAMYNPRIQKGTENYISGYGFGILAEGNVTADLASETKAGWKKYYHSASTSDPLNINLLNAQGSQVSDLASYITSSYWGTKMNEQRNGYDWYPSLAKESRPLGGTGYDVETGAFTASADQTGKSSWFKFHVRTGADGGVQFRSLSDKPTYKAFDQRDVTIEDYVDAFKVLLTKSFGLYRGAELAADTSYGIVGAKEYYESTGASEGIDDDGFASKVKIFSGTDAGGDYLVINMTTAVTPFYAMYGLSSALYQPMSREFLTVLGGGDIKLGVTRYGTFITGVASNIATPVDTILSLGAYTLEYWEEQKAIAFKKNDAWFENDITGMENLYRIPGVKITVYPGGQTDNTLIFKEFLKGNVDVAGIPTIDYIKKYRNDSRTTTTTGDSVFKLNVNSCTQERWEELFGTDGQIMQTQEANYWDVKPWMSNKSFLKGLNFSIDRGTYAANRGRIASNQYLSSNYMIDPENGLAWNASDQHIEAMADYYPDTHGYNLSAAKIYFRQAVNEMVEDGVIELGTKKRPTKISISIHWMNPSDSEDYGEEIAGFIQNAFNSSYVSGGKVKLSVINYDGTTNFEDVYNNHLMTGQYDLGFGSISGNALDPLNFFEVLKSDNASGFTLNWGTDTSVVSENLIYNDQPWSYDALWQAGDSFVVAEKGIVTPLFVLLSSEVELLADGRLQVLLSAKEVNTDDIKAFIYALAIYAQTSAENYEEVWAYKDGTTDTDEDGVDSSYEVVVDEDGISHYTIIFDAGALEYLIAGHPDDGKVFRAGVDVIIYTAIYSLGVGGGSLYTTIVEFDSWPSLAEPAPAPYILD